MKNRNKRTIILLIISIFFVAFFQTIAYSSFSSTINITGGSVARVETDVRITDFSLYDVDENVVSSYEYFSKDTISSNVSFSTDSSSITYRIEVTNYGLNSIGILDITGLPSNLSYELIDYNLNDKLCDESGKCNNYAIKTFYIKITGSSGIYDINLLFDFMPYLTVTYINMNNNNYPSEVIYNGNLNLDIGIDNAPGVLVKLGGIDTDQYTYKEGIINIENINDNVIIEGFSIVKSFSHVGSYQLYTIPYDGIYKIELWGAGSVYSGDGYGAYTSGKIEIDYNKNLYFYVGSAGVYNNTTSGGYNGGGGTRKSTLNTTGATGGGATDVRYFTIEPSSSDLTWSSTLGLNSRIMVAAGSGGGTSAGGLKGYDSYKKDVDLYGAYMGNGATQTSGGAAPTKHQCAASNGTAGSFGKGGTGGASGDLDSLEYGGGSGGGGGYYGGSGASGLCNGVFPAGSGSSFISGHKGCVAITSSSSTTPRNNSSGSKCANGTTDITCSYHYSNLIFMNTVMIDGRGYNWTTSKGTNVVGMPTFDGTGTMTGNSGNGYAKITLIEMIKE